MKVLYIIISVVLCVVYVLASLLFYATDISYSLIGTPQIVYRVITALGTLIAPLGFVGVILGFRFRKREEPGRALLCTFGGFLMILAVSLCLVFLNSFGGNWINKSLYAALQQNYGEDFDAPSNYEQLPETYQIILDKKYVAVRDRWDRDALMAREHLSWKMPEYYGEDSLENIGFCVMDLNADGKDELLIGEVTPEGTPTTIFSVYSDPEQPHQVYQTYDTMLHYLHEQEQGLYYVECDVEYDDGEKETYLLLLTYGVEGYRSNDVVIDTTADPADRCHIDLIPFADYR